MRTTVAIDDQLLELARRRAQERRTTLGAVIEEALRAALMGDRPAEGGPFQLVTFRGDGPMDGVDLDHPSQLLAVEDAEWYGRR
ncbi:MAG TPA: type II toxin-antitoxin system VapB family antitoxin [Polyangia bacterium]|jgi:hypothetical protein